MESLAAALGRRMLPPSIYKRVAASSLARRLAHGSMWSVFGSATSRIMVLVSMILVARVLGRVSFGELGLIQSTLGIAGLMAGISLGSTATRFLAKYASTDPDRAGRIVALVTSVSVASVTFAAIVLVSVSGVVADAMLNSRHLESALVWGALLMAATAIRGIQEGIFAGLERFDTLAKLNVMDGAISLLTMLSLARIMGVTGAVIGLALGSVFVTVVGRFLLATELKRRGISVRYRGCTADWRILTGYSLPSLLTSLLTTPVLWYAMTRVAQSPQGTSGLGLYNAAYQWHGPIMFIPLILNGVSIPALVQEWEAGNHQRFRAVTLWVCTVMLAVSVPPAAIAAMLSPLILDLYGEGFREGWLVLVLLLLAAPFHALSKITSTALLCMNQAWKVLGANLLWSFTLVAFVYSQVANLGVMALAIGFFVSHAVLAIASTTLIFIYSRANGGRL